LPYVGTGNERAEVTIFSSSFLWFNPGWLQVALRHVFLQVLQISSVHTSQSQSHQVHDRSDQAWHYHFLCITLATSFLTRHLVSKRVYFYVKEINLA
jgi:hypothetical protein